jgi:hypothetical protein
MATISEAEKRSRRQSAESVIGTSAMEGITLDAPTLALMRRFQEGEIDLDQMSAGIDRHMQSLLDARQTRQPKAESAAVNAA